MLQKNLHRQNSRHGFIGGSDARIIMGQDEKALIRLWQEKRGEVGRKISRATSSSNSVSPPRTSIGAGTSAIPGGPSRRCRAGSNTRSLPSWRPPFDGMVYEVGWRHRQPDLVKPFCVCRNEPRLRPRFRR